MRNELLTSTEVARMLGVGPTTVKRWADTGLIQCIKTAGNHRRFRRTEVERLLSRGALPEAPAEATGTPDAQASRWIELLTGEAPLQEVQAELLAARAGLGSWWEVADSFAPVLELLGLLWSTGQLSVVEEHLASERLARALAATAHSLPARRDAPRCLLTVPEGEEHTLGLSLAELALREAGWATRWAGRRTPLQDIVAAASSGRVEAVALSASAYSLGPDELAPQAALLAGSCRAARVPLLLGGEGEWPEGLPGTHRLRTYAELNHLLKTLA